MAFTSADLCSRLAYEGGFGDPQVYHDTVSAPSRLEWKDMIGFEPGFAVVKKYGWISFAGRALIVAAVGRTLRTNWRKEMSLMAAS